jgi:hypothetical protein
MIFLILYSCAITKPKYDTINKNIYDILHKNQVICYVDGWYNGTITCSNKNKTIKCDKEYTDDCIESIKNIVSLDNRTNEYISEDSVYNQRMFNLLPSNRVLCQVLDNNLICNKLDVSVACLNKTKISDCKTQILNLHIFVNEEYDGFHYDKFKLNYDSQTWQDKIGYNNDIFNIVYYANNYSKCEGIVNFQLLYKNIDTIDFYSKKLLKLQTEFYDNLNKLGSYDIEHVNNYKYNDNIVNIIIYFTGKSICFNLSNILNNLYLKYNNL